MPSQFAIVVAASAAAAVLVASPGQQAKLGILFIRTAAVVVVAVIVVAGRASRELADGFFVCVRKCHQSRPLVLQCHTKSNRLLEQTSSPAAPVTGYVRFRFVFGGLKKCYKCYKCHLIAHSFYDIWGNCFGLDIRSKSLTHWHPNSLVHLV